MEFFKVIFFSGFVALCAGIFIVKDDCPPNEEYQLCGSSCPANCTAPDPELCLEDCVEGCFCSLGYLRSENGTCVSVEDCGQTPQCADNEQFIVCGSACPPTCAQPEAEVCDFACKTGCACKPGFVKDESSGQCVSLEKCPVELCLNENEIYDTCNAGCEPSCTDPEPICTKICMGGCVCAPGLFRNETGDCLSVDQCPVNGTDVGLLAKYLNAINRILHV